MARAMGTERIPVTGERDGADAQTPLFAFQFKLRRTIPAWLFSWLAGICGHAQGKQSGQVGVLVLKSPGMLDRESLVILRWADWGRAPREYRSGRLPVADRQAGPAHAQ
jgi:hypothetical protein